MPNSPDFVEYASGANGTGTHFEYILSPLPRLRLPFP